MNGIVAAFALTFAGLFPIVNPLESAPFFLALTKSLPRAQRSALARSVAINGFVLLLGSMALGPWLLEFFGIQLPVVRIAGGLVVTALGWKLLTQDQWSDHAGTGLGEDPPGGVGAFYPLTMPLTVGVAPTAFARNAAVRSDPHPPRDAAASWNLENPDRTRTGYSTRSVIIRTRSTLTDWLSRTVPSARLRVQTIDRDAVPCRPLVAIPGG